MTNIENKLLEYNQFDEKYDEEDIKLLSSLNDIQEIQQNLLSILYDQDKSLNTIETNMESIYNNISSSKKDIESASLNHVRYIPIVIGSSIGLATIGPLSLIPAFKIGGLVTGFSISCVGGFLGYKYQ